MPDNVFSEQRGAFKAIGHTKDYERVFIVQDARTERGEPMEVSMIWTVKDALAVAEYIKEAALKCMANKSGIILPRSM